MASFKYKNVYINKSYSIAGVYENNGMLNNVDRYLKDFYDNSKTTEDCEIKIQKEVLDNLIDSKTELIVGGDLSNQNALLSSSVINNNILLMYIVLVLRLMSHL